jgi:hypothetical protein
MPTNNYLCNNLEHNSRLTKMHAKEPTCFNFFNFHPVSTKFPINIEHVCYEFILCELYYKK